MSRVLLVGAGAVGGRAARQLVETPGVDELLVVDARPKRAGRGRRDHGRAGRRRSTGNPGCRSPTASTRSRARCPPATTSRSCATRSRPACRACRPPTTRPRSRRCSSSTPRRSRPGCRSWSAPGSRPGSSDVLVRHAADGLDTVDDVNVARWGAAGEASASTVRVALADRGAELRDGVVVPLVKRGGEELIWFPNPVDARGCEPVSNGLELLLHAVPGLARATIRFARAEKPGWTPAAPRRSGERVGCDPRGGVGHARCRCASRSSTARSSAPRSRPARCWRSPPPRSPARCRDWWSAARACTGSAGSSCPRAFLAELAARGVKVAVFEGVPVS